MSRAAILLLWLAAALLATRAVALDLERNIAQYKHTRWTATEGAPPIVYALAQGHDGYIWIGSAAGLYRFDGVTFEHIPPREGSANAWRATAVLAAHDGTIWVGYNGGGISAYRNGVLRADAAAPRTNAYVQGLAQTRDGTIWASVYRPNRWLLRRGTDGRWEEIGPNWGLPSSERFSAQLLAARDGALWVVTANTIFRLPAGMRRFEPVGRVSGQFNVTLNQDPAGRIWQSDKNGSRVIFSPAASDRGVFFPTPGFDGWPSLAFFDRDGNLWGLNGVGLFRLRAPRSIGSLSADERAARVERFGARDGLTADTASAFLEDREGNIWVGSTLGLDQFRLANVITEPQLTEMPTLGFGLITASDGSVYVGTRSAVYRIAPGGRPERVAAAPQGADHICEAPDGTLWIFSPGVPRRIQGSTISPMPVPVFSTILRTGGNGVAGCVVDASGVLWLNGTQAGLFSYAGGQWRRHPPAEAENWAGAIVLDQRGRPLVWTQAGTLARLGADGRPGQILLRRAQSDVNFLYQGRRDLLLGGVFGLGRLHNGALQVADPERFPWLADPHGLVETPDGQTWLFGRAGIVRIGTAELERAFEDPQGQLTPTILGFDDGLPNVRSLNSQNAVVRGGDGRLWFATVGGVVSVDPAHLHRNTIPPPVHIRSIVASGIRRLNPSQITLPKGTSSLAIQYTGLSLTVPHRVRFRYRLDGVDEDWIDAGSRREAFYTNLGAGTYRFRVVAANNDGVWNHEGATLEFTIPPTFLQSIWFTLLCVLAVALLLWLLYLVRVRQIAGRIRLALEQRLAERERIARELHDTLLQSVQGLILRFQGAADRLAPDDPARRSIEGALDRADGVLVEGRERVRALRSDAAVNDLPQALRDIAADAIAGGVPDFALIVEGGRRPLHALAGEEVQRIAEEVIRNALKHADATRIEAVLTYGTQDLRLVIRDDGVGIPDEILGSGHREGHFGLIGMRERAERIGGRLAVTSAVGRGTETSLWVPARAAYRARAGRLIDRLRGGRARADAEPEGALVQ